jgi:hypothetical protein
MDRNKVIAGSLAFALAAPYLVRSLTNPNGPLPEAPKKVAFMALQTIASTSSAISAMSVLDAILGREISVARPVDEHPRPAFIAPTSLSITLS